MTQKNIFLKFASDKNDFTIGIHSDNSNVIYHRFPKIDLLNKYQTWSDICDKYIGKKRLSLRKSGAHKKKNEEENQTIEELRNKCSSSYEELINELNAVLNNTESLKQDIKSHVNEEKTSARIICQFEEKELDIACIPWDHWDGLNDLYKENDLIVTTSTQNSSITSKYQSSLDSVSNNRKLNEASNKEGSKKIEILMILGEDKDNLNLDIDSETFESFTKDLEKRANVSVSLETIKVNSIKNLEEVLLKKEWSIIYYCGHSSAIDDENDVELELGKDILGEKVKVKISELKHIFQKLTSQGIIKVVIFNSCKSIATAFQLLPLGLPHVIAMKESIADFHAHYYIRYLLESLAIGLPLRCAAEHCQPHLRDAYNTLMDIPGASIIPALCLTSEAVSKLDDPIINLNLDPISNDMLALSNLAKSRLAIAGYSEYSDLKIQEYYANRLHRKNITSGEKLKEEELTYISRDKLFCGEPKMSGECIWEINFLADLTNKYQDTDPIIWGKGFVNIKNGNSELLLDHRPETWYGEALRDKNGNPIPVKALKIREDETDAKSKGKPSLTKYALEKLAEEYQKYAKNAKKSFESREVKNFCGWLKDVNKQLYIKKFTILAINKGIELGSTWIENLETLSNEESKGIVEISNEAYSSTPFGKARNELGISEFKIIRRDFISLGEFVSCHQWTDNQKNQLKEGGFDEKWWDTLKVPDVIIVSEAKRP